MRLTTQFSALPVGRCSRKRRIRPLLKQTLLCKFIIIVSREQIIKSLQFTSFEIYGYDRFLKVAVIGKVLLQSSGLMKTEAVTKKSVELIWTHPHGRGLGLTNKI